MSKMSQMSAEMDNKNVPTEERNSLIDRVSKGMHAAEKKIDTKQLKSDVKKVDIVKQASETIAADDIDIAKKIRVFADRTHNVVTLGGKSYVKVGAYQYLAKLLGITPVFDFDPASTQTEVWCVCTLRKDGSELTHTAMYADRTEIFLRDKPEFAVTGMAQTRAFVRAMKNVYGYLMELAGYQSVAIEEIDREENNNG